MRSCVQAATASFVLAMTAGCGATDTEEAAYTVEKTAGRFEVRRYEPQVVAEVRVEAAMEAAGNQAFRLLYGYISGDNRGRTKIAMTAPVGQEPAQGQGEKIAMTSPVSQQKTSNTWAVTFMMPSSYTLETLPEPRDSRVRLRRVPAQRMAAVRYRGRWTRQGYEQHLDRLQTWMEQNGLQPAGTPVWARYNPPFTPPFLRRNEVLIPVKGDADTR